MTTTEPATTDADADPEPQPDPVVIAAAEQAEHSRALERVAAGDVALELVPGFHEMQGMAAMAVTLAGAGACPAELRGKPNDVFLVLLTARELGIAPTAALRTCAIVKGRVTLQPKLRAAMVRTRGLGRLWPGERTNTTATWFGVHRDDPETVHAFTFTWADAQQAHLADDRCSPGAHVRDCKCGDNYRNYPQRMISWRAQGYLLDDLWPEVGTGLYSPEEMGAMVDDEGAPLDVREVEPLPGTKAPSGHRAPSSMTTDPPASADELAALKARTDRLKLYPGTNDAGETARAALMALWNAPRDGSNPLPVLPDLLTRHLPRAKAMVTAIEKRAEKGEWGELPPDGGGGDDGAEPDPEPDDDGLEGDPDGAGRLPDLERGSIDPEAAADVAAQDAAGDPDPGPRWSSDVELAQLVVDEVRAMDRVDVIAGLTLAGKDAPRDEADQRNLLAKLLYLERGGKPESLEQPGGPENVADPAEPAPAPEAPASLMDVYAAQQGDAPSAGV